MTSKNHLRQLQELKLAIPPLPDAGEPLMIVHPDEWPADVQADYWAAQDAGNTERRFQILEVQTGTRPSRHPEALVIHFVTRPDGPQ